MKRSWMCLAVACSLTLATLAWAADEEDAEAGQDAEASSPPQVTISISDTSANQALAMAFAVGAQFNNETTEGYQKSYALEGNPVHESYENEAKAGSITTMAGGRFNLEVKVTGLSPEEMQAWLKRVDLKGLAQAKPDEGATIVHFKKLLTYLPNPPEGWTADKPTGSTGEAMGFKSSQVERVYRKK